MPVCMISDPFHSLGTDATGWHIDDPRQRYIMVGVVDEVQVRQQILDFPTLVEFKAIDNLIGQTSTAERVFQ